MATDLRDRLGDLASHTPPGTPPADLWQRGVRRRRLARAGTAGMVFALVALLGLGGWAWRLDHTRVEPVAPNGAPHLPDRFFEPSPWLSVFDGPPGRLVAVGAARRKSLLQTRADVYGVTASDGRYGFLGLPRFADRGGFIGSSPFALSPDGHSIAFWMTGTPSGSPNTDVCGQTITGMGVYDATTGRLRTADLPTRHGLAPEALAWSDSRTVVMSVGQTVSGDDDPQRSSSWNRVGLLMWPLEGPEPVLLHLPSGVTGLDELSAGRGFVLVGGAASRTRWLVWPREPARDRSIVAPVGSAVPVASPRATRLAEVTGDRNPNHLLVGRLPSGSRSVHVTSVNQNRRYYRPLAWTDEHHVAAVVQNPAPGDTRLSVRIDLVDADTGSSRTLVRRIAGGGNAWNNVLFATDLLTAPSSRGTAPPHEWNRRGVAIGLLIGVFLLVLLTRGLRGRRA